MYSRPSLPSLLGAIGFCISVSHGNTVNYASTLPPINQETNFLSDGTTPLDEHFQFQIGSFNPGFTPTAANKDLWAARWNRAAVAFYQNRRFTGSHTLSNNNVPFTDTTRGYIWGFSRIGTRNQWLLVSDASWTWPDAFDPFGFPVEWTISTAGQVIIGSIMGSGFHMKMADAGTSAVPTLGTTPWRSAYFSQAELANSALSGWNADADKDGITNFMEYLTGTNPRAIGLRNLPVPSVFTLGASSYLMLTLNKPAHIDSVFGAEASENLTTWSAAQTTTVTNSAALYQVRDTVEMSNTARRRFLRVKVAQPNP